MYSSIQLFTKHTTTKRERKNTPSYLNPFRKKKMFEIIISV